MDAQDAAARKESELFDTELYFTDDLKQSLASCRLCPKECGVNRLAGETGFCGAGLQIRAARAALHHWEEPCLSGTRGSGTVFFSGCNLRCAFCQNAPISRGQAGAPITIERLTDIFFELRDQGAHNINLVTPTQYIPQITAALRAARDRGLDLPVVCNSGGYENVEALRLWEGLVDIYLPDLKFFSAAVSKKLCGAPDYFTKASAAIAEMFRQTGKPAFDGDGILTKGVIVRHLMLPGYLFDTRKVLDYLTRTYGNDIYISLMNQYTPPSPARPNAPEHPLSPGHYDAMVDFLVDRGQENAYVQEPGTDSESFIPPFDLNGIM